MGKAYDYYVCIGRHRKRTPCARKYVSLVAIEEGVERFYETFQVRAGARPADQGGGGHELVNERAEAAVMARIAEKRLREARTEREALLKAHYAGAVP